MPEATTRAGHSPWGELDSLVFAGAYADVVRRVARGFEDADAPAVVAALALGGRLDEAESVFEARLGARGPLRQRAAFFLIAGLCHAGNSERALGYVRQSVSTLRRGAALDRYWACQGLALLRHFEGHLRRSWRVARRALAAAVEADFPYGRFLSLDLLAHVAVHLGQVHAGMRLLTQASELADALGYADNATTERAAHLLFELRFALGGEAKLGAVTSLVSAPGVSYFTRRNGLLELSSAHALRGAAAEAQAALEEARRIALTGADRRARARYFIGHAFCLALSDGPEAARASLDEARAEARGQLALSGEIAFVDLLFCGAPTAEALLDAERVARLSGAERARIAWLLGSGQEAGPAVRIEDGLCRLLVAAAPLAPLERLRLLVGEGKLGLCAWALGKQPSRRLVVLGQSLLSENRGRVSASELKNRPALRLLLELGRGYRSRADLMRDVWNIGHFVPQRHTPTLHTAISRLRVAVAVPDWIVTHDDGYSLDAGVELVVLSDELPLVSTAPGASLSLPPPNDRERVLRVIDEAGALSSAEVAKALRLSGSTALRLLRGLCEEGVLDRQGGGRSTRYLRSK